MNDKENAIDAFQLFNRKANEMMELSFVKIITEQNSVTLSSFIEDGEMVSVFERQGPNTESIKAFINDFRFFVIKNERSSFRKMEGFYENAPISNLLKTNFKEAKNLLNSFLDSSTDIQWEENILTHRDIMNTFINGGLVHANDRTAEKLFEKWQSNPPFFPIIESKFLSILQSVLNIILFVRKVNEKALEEMRDQ